MGLVRALRGETWRGFPRITKRITKLVEDLLELDRLRSTRTKPVFSKDPKTGVMRPDEAIFRRVQEINRQLCRYKSSPSIELDGNWWSLEHWPDHDPPQWWVVESALELARDGQISRIRRCSDCQSWYFARFAHQRFCTARCRERAFRSSEEWKKHRREKARDYYWLHKNAKVKEQNYDRRSNKRH
jgi:hypothetical protein